MKTILPITLSLLSAFSMAQSQPSQQAIDNFVQAREYHTTRYYQATSLVRFDDDPVLKTFQHDPKASKRKRLTLLSVDDKTPTDDDIEEFVEEFYDSREKGKDGIHPKMDTLTLASTEKGLQWYNVKLQWFDEGDLDKKISRAFKGRLLYDPIQDAFVKFESHSVKTFSPQFMVKLTQFNYVESYELFEQTWGVDNVDVDFTAKSVGMTFEGGIDVNIEYLSR
jgi:hypothetical protein